MKDFCNQTSINTRINSNIRISSIFGVFEDCQTNSWDTIVYENNKIKEQFESNSYDEVMELHKKIYDKFVFENNNIEQNNDTI